MHFPPACRRKVLLDEPACCRLPPQGLAKVEPHPLVVAVVQEGGKGTILQPITTIPVTIGGLGHYPGLGFGLVGWKV